MSNEVASLEAEIKEYKLQVSTPIPTMHLILLTLTTSIARDCSIRITSRPRKCRSARTQDRA